MFDMFHVLFHLAGILYVFRDKLMLYYENVCHNTTTLRTASIQRIGIIIELMALGNWTLDEAFLCQLKTEEAPSPHLSFLWTDYYTKRLVTSYSTWPLLCLPSGTKPIPLPAAMSYHGLLLQGFEQ